MLERKGVRQDTLERLKRLYSGGVTIPVINNVNGKAVYDIRGALRQGGLGSMDWFSYGVDPLLIYLEKKLSGILVSSVPVSGPGEESGPSILPPLEKRFKAGES